MIGQFIAVLFLARDIAHREHLRVSGRGSYAKHQALGAFYEEVINLADSLAEAYQGRHGIIKNIAFLDNEFPGEIVTSLKNQLKYLEANRYKAVQREETALNNIIDEIVVLYLSTLYKLENLE
jgi:hypothetical protein